MSTPDPKGSIAGQEHRETKASLIGFYLSCAGVAIGATVGAAGFLWFENMVGLGVGIAMTLFCSVTCYTSLSRMRR
ncbi:MAG: hypothetical protein RLZZ562_861 [Planctomycetota bacterium]